LETLNVPLHPGRVLKHIPLGEIDLPLNPQMAPLTERSEIPVGVVRLITV
jgi:hypothetical protein